MKIRKKIKRSTRQYILVAFICISVIGGAAAFTTIVITGQIRVKYKALLSDAYQDMENNQRRVLIASTDIVSGEVISEDKVESKLVYSSQPQDSYLTQMQLGKTALVQIPAGTQIIGNMVTDHFISEKLREIEYHVINLSSNIIENDTVDIRIFFPNGESYVVLSKKEIKGIIAETASVFLWLEEEELLRMSAAIVDAGLYPGSSLYVTKYIEPNVQKASIINYTPSISILTLIENDPNIIERCSKELSKEVRKALENRLADSLDTDVAAINWDIDLEQVELAGSEALSQNTTEDVSEHIMEEHLDNNAKEPTEGFENPPAATDNITNPENIDDIELGVADYFYYAEDSSDDRGQIGLGE